MSEGRLACSVRTVCILYVKVPWFAGQQESHQCSLYDCSDVRPFPAAQKAKRLGSAYIIKESKPQNGWGRVEVDRRSIEHRISNLLRCNAASECEKSTSIARCAALYLPNPGNGRGAMPVIDTARLAFSSANSDLTSGFA